jgi:hypothetical protein
MLETDNKLFSHLKCKISSFLHVGLLDSECEHNRHDASEQTLLMPILFFDQKVSLLLFKSKIVGQV